MPKEERSTRSFFAILSGGFANGGLVMGDYIRSRGLNTAFQGGCYSACAAAFSGGVQRGMARFNLPVTGFLYANNTLGYHGASLDGEPADAEVQEFLLNVIVPWLEPDLTEGGLARIRLSHLGMADSGAFLRYLDPAVTDGAATIWCDSVNGLFGAAPCTEYDESVDIYTDGIVTRPGYVDLQDILQITGTVSGDLNPNYSASGGLNDTYGAILVGSGGVWNLATTSSASITGVANEGTLTLQAGGALNQYGSLDVAQGGRLNLSGGIFGTSSRQIFYSAEIPGFGTVPFVEEQTGLVNMQGTLSGRGRVGGLVAMAPFSRFEPEEISIVPYVSYDRVNRSTPGLDFPGMVLLFPEATMAVDIRNDKTTPYVTVGQSQLFRSVDETQDSLHLVRRVSNSYLNLSTGGANLELNFKPGFYRPGQRIDLVKIQDDMTQIARPSLCSTPGTVCDDTLRPLSTFGAILDRFSTVTRGNDSRRFELPTTGLNFNLPVAENSLLSFDLIYLASQQSEFVFDGLYLEAKSAFEDTSLFANKLSGDGLGRALLATSKLDAPINTDLLGALQFSTKAVVQAQSGALRGDGFATQRLSDAALIAGLDQLSLARIEARQSGRTDLTLAPLTADLASGVGRDGRDGAADLASAGRAMLRYLVDGPAQTNTAIDPASTGWQVWGQFVSGKNQIEADQSIAQIETDWSGIVIGGDRRFGDGKLLAGINAAYVSGQGASPADVFQAETDTTSVSAYAGLTHRLGSIDGSARYSRMSHQTKRVVNDIVGLQAPNEADYKTDILSVHVENAFTVPDTGAFGVKVLAPTIDYASISSDGFAETGSAARLGVEYETFESVRLGLGLEVTRRFENETGSVQPYARVTYQHEAGDTGASASAFFAGQPAESFIVNSQELGSDITQFRMGVTAHQTDRFSVAVEYLGENRSGATSQGGFVGLSYRF